MYGPLSTLHLACNREALSPVEAVLKYAVTCVQYPLLQPLLLFIVQIMTGWNPESLYAMLGESTRQNLENPASRMMSRKLMAPGFSREAMRQYLTKVGSIAAHVLCMLWCWVVIAPCTFGLALGVGSSAASFQQRTTVL